MKQAYVDVMALAAGTRDRCRYYLDNATDGDMNAVSRQIIRGVLPEDTLRRAALRWSREPLAEADQNASEILNKTLSGAKKGIDCVVTG